MVREAHQLLKRAPRINYVGNIEGRDILPGPQQRIPVDVVVCDGFVGNIVLKFYESSARVFVGLLKDRIPDAFEPSGDGRPQPHPRLLHLRRGAAARRAGRLHHLPRRVQPQRDQERDPGGGAGGAARA